MIPFKFASLINVQVLKGRRAGLSDSPPFKKLWFIQFYFFIKKRERKGLILTGPGEPQCQRGLGLRTVRSTGFQVVRLWQQADCQCALPAVSMAWWWKWTRASTRSSTSTVTTRIYISLPLKTTLYNDHRIFKLGKIIHRICKQKDQYSSYWTSGYLAVLILNGMFVILDTFSTRRRPSLVKGQTLNNWMGCWDEISWTPFDISRWAMPRLRYPCNANPEER